MQEFDDDEFIHIEEEDLHLNGHAQKSEESFSVAGSDVVGTVRRLIQQANVRRIIVRSPEGRDLMNVPLSLGIVGLVLFPVWTALGALASILVGTALLMDYTITVEYEA